MEKHQVISFIQSQLAAGSITKADLAALASGEEFSNVPYASGPVAKPADVVGHAQRNLINVFYAIGAIIVLTGIVILVAQHWTDIGFAGRLLVTGGIALVAYGAGMFLRSPAQNVLSQVFFTIAAALAPLGVYVVLSQQNIGFGLMHQIFTAVGLAAVFGAAWFLTRRNVLVIFTTFFLTWAYYATIFKSMEGLMYQPHLLTWATIAVGTAYILVGYGYARSSAEGEASRENRSVRNLLYALGTLAVLGAGFSLDGFWDLVYIPLLFAMFYLSVFLRTRAMLIIAALYLIAHLVYLTSKYFVDSIGWPIALVICGFIIIGIGYASLYVMRKYLK